MKISVCIITLNEEENLRRCLGSCAALADEIVVLDSGSTDGTETVAREFGACWAVCEWPGYVQQKNKVIQMASYDWVLSLDADEAISPNLLGVLKRLKQEGAPVEVGGYSIPRCVYYEGKWIRHGDWYPDRLVRLFRRTGASFAGGRANPDAMPSPNSPQSLRELLRALVDRLIQAIGAAVTRAILVIMQGTGV